MVSNNLMINRIINQIIKLNYHNLMYFVLLFSLLCFLYKIHQLNKHIVKIINPFLNNIKSVKFIINYTSFYKFIFQSLYLYLKFN